MKKTTVLLLTGLAVVLWYWITAAQEGERAELEAHLAKNAEVMKRCINREKSMNAAAGISAVGGLEQDSKAACAEKYGMYYSGGQWRRIHVESNEP